MLSPFLSSKVHQSLAFELPDQGVGFVAIEELRPRREYLSDQVRVGDGDASRRPKPQQERRTYERDICHHIL